MQVGINRVLERPIVLEGEEVFCKFSFGIALSSNNYVQAEGMFQDAKVALADAKASGGDCHRVFDEGMRSKTSGLLQVESDLRKAVRDGGQLLLHYQPIVEPRGKMVGFEALMRWAHPSRGLLGPGEFIALAEDTGLIVPMGQWALAEAARQLKEWDEIAGASGAPPYVAVNVSSRQFSAGTLIGDVENALRDAGIAPDRLGLEVTESLLMENPESALGQLRELKAIGVRLSIDDFGTGFSSLAYLRRFPFDVLKVDRSFINEIVTNRESREIVRTIVNLADTLKLQVVAEGVESERQARILDDIGCEFLQGYYFATPLPAHEAARAAIERTRTPEYPKKARPPKKPVLMGTSEPENAS